MKVVAKKYLLNQTALFSNETIFTSTEGGDYLLSVYVQGDSTSVGSGSFSFDAHWTDELGLETLFAQGNLSWASINKQAYSWAYPTQIRLTPGASVTLSASAGSTAPPAGSFFSIYVVLIELSAPGL